MAPWLPRLLISSPEPTASPLLFVSSLPLLLLLEGASQEASRELVRARTASSWLGPRWRWADGKCTFRLASAHLPPGAIVRSTKVREATPTARSNSEINQRKGSRKGSSWSVACGPAMYKPGELRKHGLQLPWISPFLSCNEGLAEKALLGLWPV
eukprot:1150870-Pelagomonas_calceolata.AAC.17